MTNQPTVWPGLTYDDAPAALTLLTETFGFTAALVVRDESGVDIAHAELRWPEGGAVMLGSTKQKTDAAHPGSGGSSVYVVTDDPDAVYARAMRAGVEITVEMHDTDYGSHTFSARDGGGNVWTFGTYRGA